MKTTKRMTFEDRKTIERLLKIQTPIVKIADEIGVTRDTIYKELRRCDASKTSYNAEIAQKSL